MVINCYFAIFRRLPWHFSLFLFFSLKFLSQYQPPICLFLLPSSNVLLHFCYYNYKKKMLLSHSHFHLHCQGSNIFIFVAYFLSVYLKITLQTFMKRWVHNFIVLFLLYEQHATRADMLWVDIIELILDDSSFVEIFRFVFTHGTIFKLWLWHLILVLTPVEIWTFKLPLEFNIINIEDFPKYTTNKISSYVTHT